GKDPEIEREGLVLGQQSEKVPFIKHARRNLQSFRLRHHHEEGFFFVQEKGERGVIMGIQGPPGGATSFVQIFYNALRTGIWQSSLFPAYCIGKIEDISQSSHSAPV